MSAKIEAQLSLDGALFKHGLREAKAEAEGLFKTFALGAVGAFSIEQAFEKTVESAEELVNASRKLGVTVEQLQVLRQAAEDNGVEFDAMTSALLKFNATRENVLHGGKGSADQIAALARLGVTPEVLKSLQSNLPEPAAEKNGAKSGGATPGQNAEELRRQAASTANVVMGQISDFVRRNNLNPDDVAKDLKDVFGKSGQQIFGVLQTNFEELEAKMRESGAIMESQIAYKLKALGEEYGLISRIITAQLAPALLAFAEWAYKLALTGGGYVAGAGAWLGGAFQTLLQADDQSASMDDAANKSHADAIRRAGNDKIPGGESSVEQNQSIVDAAMKPWEDRVKEFETMLKRAGDRAANIPAPQTDFDAAAAKTKRAKTPPSDSLISVGNFLGAGRGQIGSVAEQHLQVSKQQLAATNLVAGLTQKLLDSSAEIEKVISAIHFGGGVNF